MAEVDAVEYNGITFRRYPESDNYADRRYYRPSGTHIKDGVEALHREVWKDHHGEIPDGKLIHHKDGDPTNNDIENLECVTPEEHARRHPDMGNADPEHIGRIVELAKEWHRSEEGREWHRQHWEESLGKAFDETQKECDQCGESFVDYSAQDAGRFCSNACKAAARRERGDDDVVRECTICRSEFVVNKYADTETCSRSCSGALQSWTKRVQS